MTDLKRLAGQMMWVVTQTWPDVSFGMIRMSNTGEVPKGNLLYKASKSLLKLNSIYFPYLGKPTGLNIISYSDATDTS